MTKAEARALYDQLKRKPPRVRLVWGKGGPHHAQFLSVVQDEDPSILSQRCLLPNGFEGGGCTILGDRIIPFTEVPEWLPIDVALVEQRDASRGT